MELTAEEREVVTVCAELTREIEATPEPPAWRRWELDDWNDLRTYGPRYRPAEWFGGGESLPVKWQSRYLRAVYALEERGYLETFAEGKRMANVRLTAAGLALAGQLESGGEA